MPESKSGALPLGDIPILKQRPLAGHTEHYSTDKQNLQEYFVEFPRCFRKFPPSPHPRGTLHTRMGCNQSSFLRRQVIAADIADALIIFTALRDDAGKFHATLLHHSAGIGVMGIVVGYQQFHAHNFEHKG